jgi:hypothetical protein
MAGEQVLARSRCTGFAAKRQYGGRQYMGNLVVLQDAVVFDPAAVGAWKMWNRLVVDVVSGVQPDLAAVVQTDRSLLLLVKGRLHFQKWLVLEGNPSRGDKARVLVTLQFPDSIWIMKALVRVGFTVTERPTNRAGMLSVVQGGPLT